jgi:hypothetical protein
MLDHGVQPGRVSDLLGHLCDLHICGAAISLSPILCCARVQAPLAYAAVHQTSISLPARSLHLYLLHFDLM